jgi:hypothetical protein
MGLIPRPPLAGGSKALSRKRKALALLVAGATDLLQLVFFPMVFEGAASPFEWVLDLVTAFVLTLILGFRWRTLLGIAVELVPGLDLFPTWMALVLSLPSAPKGQGGSEGGPRELPSNVAG